MAEASDILGIGIFVIVTGVALVIAFSSFTSYLEESSRQSLGFYDYYSDNAKFETFLTSTNTYTKRSNIETMALAIGKPNGMKTLYGNLFLNDTILEELNYIYGEGNYYLKIRPRLKAMRFLFLYDDAGFMKAINDQHHFAQVITNLAQTEGDFPLDLEFKVYILGNENSDACDEYGDEIDCTLWGIDQEQGLYGDVGDYYDDPIRDKFYPGKEYYFRKYYGENDYGTYLGRVSEENSEFRDSSGTIDIILLFTDVVSLGGANDTFFFSQYDNYQQDTYQECKDAYVSCYEDSVIPSSSFQECYDLCILNFWSDGNYNEVKFKNCAFNLENENSCLSKSEEFATCRTEYLECDKELRELDVKKSEGQLEYQYSCVPNTNLTASDYTIDRALTTLLENNQIVFPLLVGNDHFEETPEQSFALKAYMEEAGIDLGEELYGGDEETVCGKSSCLGCYEDANKRIFHNETRIKHEEQLQKIAEETTGKVVNFDENSNLEATIKEFIELILSRQEEIIGEKKDIASKQVIEKRHTLELGGEDVVMDIYLEVYKETPYTFTGDRFFKPVLNDVEIRENNFSILVSHNKELISATLPSSEGGNLEVLESEEGLLYKYNISFQTKPPFPINISLLDSLSRTSSIEIGEEQ